MDCKPSFWRTSKSKFFLNFEKDKKAIYLKNFTIEKSYILKYFIILDHYGFISNRNPTNTNDMFPARTGAKWFHIIYITRTLFYHIL